MSGLEPDRNRLDLEAILRYFVTVMDPSRKRRIRLVVALTAAVLLAGALVYTSFGDSNEAVTPKKLLSVAIPGHSYQLTGTVVPGSIRQTTAGLSFRVRDRTDHTSVPIAYTGAVPDPFKNGREIIVTVRKGSGSQFVGEHDSLITKCPSKFTDKTSA